VVVSIAVDALGIVPYAVLTKIITINNTIASWIGILLLLAVYSVTKQQLGLFWTDVMDESDIGQPVSGTLGAWVVTGGTVFGLIGGVITGLPATPIGWVCTLAIIIGSILL
jgi:energy-coupling factor transport system substrate-specific component